MPPCSATTWRSRASGSRRRWTARKRSPASSEAHAGHRPARLDAPGRCRASRSAARSAGGPRHPRPARSSWSPPAPRTQDTVRGLNTGADDYITKPFNVEALRGPHARAAAPRPAPSRFERRARLPRHHHGPRLPTGCSATAAPSISAPPSFACSSSSCSIRAASSPAKNCSNAVWGLGHPRRAAHGGRAHPSPAQERSTPTASWMSSAPSAPPAMPWIPSRPERTAKTPHGCAQRLTEFVRETPQVFWQTEDFARRRPNLMSRGGPNGCHCEARSAVAIQGLERESSQPAADFCATIR